MWYEILSTVYGIYWSPCCCYDHLGPPIVLTMDPRMVNKLGARSPMFFKTYVCLVVILRSTPNHTQLNYRWLIKISVRIRHAHLGLLHWVVQSGNEWTSEMLCSSRARITGIRFFLVARTPQRMPSHRSSELLNRRQAPPRGSNAQTLLDFTSIACPNWNEAHVQA